MKIDNRTPFVAERSVCQDRNGRDHLLVVLKATFCLDNRGRAIPDEEQLPLVIADKYVGDEGKSSLLFEGELIPPKPTTDVILVGHAYGRGAIKVDVGLRVGDLSKMIRVFGDRFWDFGVIRDRITTPHTFEKMPLVYERAFGGEDCESEEKKRSVEARNPVGCGYRGKASKEGVHPLPNLENPLALISRESDRPQPACFGFVGRNWKPRVDYIGTYDEAWRKNRFPLLPVDFDERYFNSAHPELIANAYLQGNEPVEAHNVTEKYGPWTFNLPGIGSVAEVMVGKKQESLPLSFDTLLLLPDSYQFVMIWRGSIDIHNRLLNVTNIQIDTT